MLDRFLAKLGIYPHDGKKVIFVKNGEFHSGQVFGRHTLTGGTPLSELDEASRQTQVIEAANSLRVTPDTIEQRLGLGNKVAFRPRQ